MPYDGGSVTGLINLLFEVTVPHAKMQPMAYSAPAITEAKHQRHIWVGYFSFFRPHPKTGWEKEKYRSIVKELIYRTISFRLRSSSNLLQNLFDADQSLKFSVPDLKQHNRLSAV
ncbi:MAG: hypothetical protein ACYS72_07260 [Planctomycetota bacterium]|jgi:hypothetical protein